jgi:hypothetical protein
VFFISGFTNKQLRGYLSDKSVSQFTRLLKRLRVHGVIKAEGLEYHPLNGGRQQKSLPLKGRLLVSCERGGARTLNKRLKRPLLYH